MRRSNDVILKIPTELLVPPPALGYRQRVALQLVNPLMSALTWIGSAGDLHGYVKSLEKESRTGQRVLHMSGPFLALLQQRTGDALSSLRQPLEQAMLVDHQNDLDATQDIPLPMPHGPLDYTYTHTLFYNQGEVPQHLAFSLLADNFTIRGTMIELASSLSKSRYPLLNDYSMRTLSILFPNKEK
ncbi:hypothetical protein KC909_05070 [Candidatus Dojkabacteria bacterium]|uniref:Uncharacterized protein n=1 Tax=Candidatus Dojkabacteria bacterium TaxID=2099670 RepID=A0A955RJS8_9BACT|nr:hypothetical protein [Candidatus Dojkabacteria bacterium]